MNSVEAQETGPRTLWMWSQNTNLFSGSKNNQKRDAIVFQNNHFHDILFTQLAFGFDFKDFEIIVQGSERSFLHLIDTSKKYENSLLSEQHGLGVEVARYFVGENNHFGRVGIQWGSFFPVKTHLFSLSMMTGRIDKDWNFLLGSGLSFFMNGRGSLLSLKGEISKNLNDDISFGGSVNWSLWLKDFFVMSPLGNFYSENMLFQMGPFINWNWSFMKVQAVLPSLQIFLDRQRVASSLSNITVAEFAIASQMMVSIPF